MKRDFILLDYYISRIYFYIIPLSFLFFLFFFATGHVPYYTNKFLTIIERNTGTGIWSIEKCTFTNPQTLFTSTNPPHIWLWYSPKNGITIETGQYDAKAPSWLQEDVYQSVQANAGSFIVSVVNASITRILSSPYYLKEFPLPSYFDSLPLNHQGDFGSIALLAEFGGVYMDNDVLLLHSLDAIFELLSWTEFIGFGGHDRSFYYSVHHGFMAARAKSTFAVQAYKNALKMFEEVGGCSEIYATCSTPNNIYWLRTLESYEETAANILRPLSINDRGCKIYRLPTRHYEPITSDMISDHPDYCEYTINNAMNSYQSSLSSKNHFPPESISRFIVNIMEAALSGRLRLLHLSATKQSQYMLDSKNKFKNRDEARKDALLSCPLLAFFLSISKHETNNEVIHLIQATTQHTQYIWPSISNLHP